MPKILKFSQVTLDSQNRVNIEIMPTDEFPEANEEPYISREELAESIVENARKHADEIVEEASRIAEKTYAELSKTVEDAKREAYEQAQKSGYMEGYNEGMAQAAAFRDKAEQTYNNALEERVQLLNTVEPQIVDLVAKILNKLIPDIVAVNPQIILFLVKKGLYDSTVSGEYKIIVSAEDCELVKNNVKQLSALVDASSSLEVVADASMKKADCVIETPFGNIDCGLNQQFNSLKKNLYYILNNR